MNKSEQEKEFLRLCCSKQKTVHDLIMDGIISEKDMERALIINRINELSKHLTKQVAIIKVADYFSISEGKINQIIYDLRIKF